MNIPISNYKTFISQVFLSKSNKQLKFKIGKISNLIVEKIRKSTNLNVKNYTYILDNYAIKHTILKHGNAQKEKLRGQIPITIDLLELIPEIVKNPDKITDGGKTKQGRRVIVFEKRIKNKIIYIQEQRTKRKELAMITMYVKKAT